MVGESVNTKRACSPAMRLATTSGALTSFRQLYLDAFRDGCGTAVWPVRRILAGTREPGGRKSVAFARSGSWLPLERQEDIPELSGTFFGCLGVGAGESEDQTLLGGQVLELQRQR